MLGSIGTPELILILVIALIIFGPRKLPELGRSLGKSLAEFKRASTELRSTLEEEIRLDEQKVNLEAQKAAAAQADAAAAPSAATTAPASTPVAASPATPAAAPTIHSVEQSWPSPIKSDRSA